MDEVANISSRLESMPISGAAQWEAFASGPRVEVVIFLAASGPCSVAELAHQMNTAPDGLYHHLRKLEDAGIVRQVGHRRVGRQTERLFDLVADRHDFDMDIRTGRNVRAFRTLLRALLRRCERLLDAAIGARAIDRAVTPKPYEFRGDATWLAEEDLAELNTHFAAIREIFERGRKTRRGRLFTLTLFMFPLVRPRAAESRKTGRMRALSTDHESSSSSGSNES